MHQKMSKYGIVSIFYATLSPNIDIIDPWLRVYSMYGLNEAFGVLYMLH